LEVGCEQELKGVPIEKKLVTRSPEGIDVLPLYCRRDAARLISSILPANRRICAERAVPTESL